MALSFVNLLERRSKLNERSYSDSYGLVGGKGPQLEGQRQDLGLLGGIWPLEAAMGR